ncbi:B1 protein-like [Euwallacea fornicatus]|uniref:B1 protein-like n=1 Tax=Euwallacea fornicatus TaxID=995702 RepID=UPI00338E14D7
MNGSVAVLICALFAGVLARPDINHSAAEASKNRLREAHKTCQSNSVTAVDETALNNLLKNGGSPPENLGPHSLCISKILGWQNQDGTVNKDNVQKGATAIYGNNEKLQKLVVDCTAPQPTPEQAAITLIKCYRSNTPPPPSLRI